MSIYLKSGMRYGVNILAGVKSILQKYVFFNEPKKKEKFILKENPGESLKHGRIGQERPDEKDGKGRNTQNSESDKNEDKEVQEKKVFKSLNKNLRQIKETYSVPENSDVVIREFDIVVKEDVIGAFIVFIDGMVDRKVISDDILQPLMVLSNLDIKGDEDDIIKYIKNKILPFNQIKVLKDYIQIVDDINFGGCAIFIDGVDTAFTADVKGWEHRGVERPNNELVIRGPQEGFNEGLRSNTALIRKRLKDENLIVENIEIGKKSKTPCSMMYIKNITNVSLVDEVRRRLEGVKVDYLSDSSELEQFIEGSSLIPTPQVVATERPDRVSSLLSQGKVAIIVSGSPVALVVPAILTELMHTPEDAYIRFPYANFLRAVRMLGVILALLLPGLYVAITNFHQEMIPTDLLLAIVASREKVPFPSVVEIFIMEVSFELIREAGIRIPGPIGPTLGIIGALILGQAAVSANIVSPILIIIVAVTGIGSFAIPNYSLGFAFRILRFAFIILGAMGGLLGISTGLFIQGLWFVGSKSFGVPLWVPFAPVTTGLLADIITRAPIWKQEKRPDYLNTKETKQQPSISRTWNKDQEDDGDNNEE